MEFVQNRIGLAADSHPNRPVKTGRREPRAVQVSANRLPHKDLEQNQSNSAVDETIGGGLSLRKTPLNGSAFGYIYSDPAVAWFPPIDGAPTHSNGSRHPIGLSILCTRLLNQPPELILPSSTHRVAALVKRQPPDFFFLELRPKSRQPARRISRSTYSVLISVAWFFSYVIVQCFPSSS
jgi:hypothetical protein